MTYSELEVSSSVGPEGVARDVADGDDEISGRIRHQLPDRRGGIGGHGQAGGGEDMWADEGRGCPTLLPRRRGTDSEDEDEERHVAVGLESSVVLQVGCMSRSLSQHGNNINVLFSTIPH